MKKYRIGEFAKRMCVTLDFVRFYEQKGLIESTVDKSNNYHYYDISQSEVIYKILQYRKLGFSANETVDLIKKADTEQILNYLSTRAAAHKDSIRMSTFSIKYLDYLKTALSTGNGTWYISRLPPLWFMPHTVGDDYLDSPDLQSAYSKWANEVPLIFSMTKWKMNDDGSFSSLFHGRALEYAVAEEFGLTPHDSFELLPERRCIEYYLDIVHPAESHFSMGPTLSIDYLQPALNIVREKNFEIDGDIFDRHIAFFTKDGQAFSKLVVYVPIK